MPTVNPSHRATSAQRETLIRLLCKGEYIADPNHTKYRTGPAWRGIFKITNTPEPRNKDTIGAQSWPTVDQWMDSLDKQQASAAISHLLREQADE